MSMEIFKLRRQDGVREILIKIIMNKNLWADTSDILCLHFFKFKIIKFSALGINFDILSKIFQPTAVMPTRRIKFIETFN
jgi:hypothetical protein